MKKKSKRSQQSALQLKPKSSKKSPALWDQAAAWYDSLVGDQGSGYQKEIIMPGAFRLLDLKKGDQTLDLACGQGVFARFLKQKGMDVEGIDISPELIRFAAARSKDKIVYHLADAAKAQKNLDDRFDAVVCLLALQNIEYIGPVFSNISRWLRKNGKFVSVLTHPCFRIPRQSHWGWDEEKKIQFRRTDHYASKLKIPILTPPIAKSNLFTMTYHRSLQEYFKELSAVGLWVDALEEWPSLKKSQPGKRSRAENRARKEIPLFMAFRARKTI